ncbi:MAG: FlgD immunoglobulin-like domain containing protein [Bacteroidales bacterium]|nr:FlgD immunoglobulin-like domain containing protein [Bacteroidales bacterium]
MKKLFTLLAVLFICSISFSQSITVTSPNGAEVLPGCTVKTITWNSSGTTDYYSIDYSTDNGLTWTSITSFYNTVARTYNWTVPNTSSGVCLIRIKDSNNSSVSDLSDAVFTITSPLTVLQPNGGETWQGSTAKSINFTASGTSNYYDISYSIDAGSNWTTIANNTYNTSGTYNWSVPNSPSTNCLVKIRDHSNSCMTDVSNGLFEITAAASSVTVTSPNGGETWYVGQSKSITWTASNTTNYYNIDYSIDNGLSWTSLASSYYAVTGTFSWTIPNTPSANCRVRVTDANNVPVTDMSNAVFTIASPYITILSPNGGENLESCYGEYINFQCGGTSNYYRIEYSINNGISWTTITSSYYSSSSNISYLWSTIPQNNSSSCLIRVTDTGNASVLDQSDATFTILPNDEIIVTSPNGGESWQVGSSHVISWVSAPSSTRYYVYYSVNGGSSWTYITNTTSTSYNWTVPDNESSNTLIKIVDYNNTCIYDISDSEFAIAPPTPIITVTNPNTSSTLFQGNGISISWTSQYVESPYVAIDYSIDNGNNWISIVTVTENDGSYPWTIPTVLSSQCLVRVSEYNNPAVFDTSNTTFTIAAPFVTVTSPNGGEVFGGCDSHTITYIKGGIGSYVKLEYSTDNGSTWNIITSSTSASGSYTWNPVADNPSTQCLIRVSDASNSSVNDLSNAVFTIQENDDIFVTSPNGGESLEVASSVTITWVAAPGHSHFGLYYSINNGTSWSTISSSLYTTSYTWTVPNAPSTTCLIKVVDYDNSCIYDKSDAVFSIEPPDPIITVTSPNTSTTLYVANTYNITWSHQYDDVSFVKIDYSTDNGSNWTNVVAVTENDGSYAWTVPNTPSNQCLVRVYEYDNMSLIDQSDVNFTIAPAYIILNQPNGGEVMTGCGTYNITWTRGGTGNYFKIEYSLDNGNTWNNINSSYYASGTTGSYTWSPLINQSSVNCLIRVSDAYNLATSDVSNAVFTINPNTNIIVTAPNGGQNLEIGDTYQITWVSAGSSTQFRVYYSTDNGTTWYTITSSTSYNYYNWTVPNAVSSQCLIRVDDYSNSCIRDYSDAVFSISEPAPNITVTNPNSSSTLYYNATTNIAWTSEFTTSEFVTIEYSTDNGSNWTTIASPTQDDGSYSWTVPQTASTECLVKVSEYGNPAVYDVSNVNFTIAAPFITVTYPNGGETLDGCSSSTITWTKGGTSNYYKFEYSLNNGIDWTLISSSYYTTGTSYTWNPVADFGSTNALFRVSDANYTMATDQSDNVFTLIKNDDIVITYPNGGEDFETGTSKTLTWVADPSVTRFYVYYSTNSGSSWTYITNTTYNYYNWTIPAGVSDHCLIKVSDYNNSCKYDISDSEFSITPPTPTITVSNPNSATTLYFTKTTTISWSSQYLSSSFVVIDYTYDDGITWNTIANATENDGSYVWTIPETISSLCRVRVSEYQNPTVYDESNVDFAIAYPYITVVSPNGGEVYEGCESTTISWTRAGVSNLYKFEYSTNGGSTWTVINSSYSTTGTSYTWSPLPDMTSSNCMIKVSDASYLNATDVSNAAFTINKNEDIILTSPNGGEFWQVGTSKTITWVSAPTSTQFRVYYSIDGGTNYTLINTTSGTSLNWTIPNLPSSTCKIKVVDYNNSCIYDASDEYFAIIPADVALTYPNGGQTLYYGSTSSITWTNQYINSNFVKLEYSVNNGASWEIIAEVTNNSGSYSWSVPNDFSTQCLVKVSQYNDPDVFDISDNVFTIAPSIVLQTPNGDGGAEVWRVCTETSIVWSANGDGNYFKIEYSINNGLTWSTIASNYYNTSSLISYNWTLPNTPSTECIVRITDVNNTIKTDASDATFTISPAINITSPNGGESITGGSPYGIIWTSDGVSNYYNIDYSTNGGSTWTSICYNQSIATNSYTWNVPSVISSNCLVRIIDNVNTCKTDVSNQVFAIGTSAANITVTYPDGGETLDACTTETIEWTSTGTSDSYNIYYSVNSGATWVSIASNYSTLTKSYAWTVPNLSAANCRIKVVDASNTNFHGESPSDFIINTVVPFAGNDAAICSGSSLNLNATGGVTYSWLPTTGLSNPSIANPIATPSATTTYTVYVTDANGCTQPDQITVTVNAIPPAPVASSNSPVDLNGTLELNASTVNMAFYNWTGPNGFSSTDQNPVIENATASLSGTYSVTATVAGCTSIASSTIVTVSGVPASSVIAGNVFTSGGSPVSGVEITLSGDNSDTFTTASAGYYDFTLNTGGAYTVSPVKDNDIVTNNGISTLDIVLMQRHILGVEQISSPYGRIAADVNRSSGITTFDIVLTRSLILQTATEFPGGDLWTFVNSDYVFSDPQNPWAYEMTRSYSSVTDAEDQDFIGIKLGDVNDSWNTNIAKSGNSELTFIMNNQQAHYGETLSIPFSALNFENLSGLQMTISWDNTLFDFASVTPAISGLFFGETFATDGKITAVWSTGELEGLSYSQDETLFTLNLIPINDIAANTSILINGEITTAEAYDSELNAMDIELENSEVEIIPTVSGIENIVSEISLDCHPNPFSDYLIIEFTNTRESETTIQIFNLVGELVYTNESILPIGINKINWDGTDANGNKLPAGNYFVKLNTCNKLITEKIVLFR